MAAPTLAAPNVGSRVADARRSAGLTQADLAERLGVDIWTVDQIEKGSADLGALVYDIGAHTGRPPEFFAVRQAAAPVEAGPVYVERTREEEKADPDLIPKRLLVVGSLSVLLLIRFFSETLPLLPGVVKFVDIPIFALLVVAALPVADRRPFPAPMQLALLMATAFAALSGLSMLTNLGRIEAAPALTYLYMFASPVFLCAAVYRLWPAGNAPFAMRWLMAIALLEVAVVAVVDLPQFLSTRNPDDVSGTFGENGYQLLIFLFITIAAMAGVLAYDSERPIARLAIPTIVASTLVIFLVQYRTLLATLALSLLLIGYFMRGRARSVIVGALVFAVTLGSLYFVATRFTSLKYASAAAELRDNPMRFVDARLEVAGDVVSVYGDDPRFVLTGTGPGTFSSRSWRTFSILENPRKTRTRAYTQRFTGGEYRTDVSDRYTLPRARAEESIDGSYQFNQPFSSYTAAAAETGVIGLFLIGGIYLVVFLWAARMTSSGIRDGLRSDPVVPISLAAAVGLFVLIQLGALENWLEVTRITFLVWALLGIAAKEMAVRRDAAT